MKKAFLATTTFVALTAGTALLANVWPQFRGPDRTDISKETGLLKSWDKPPARVWLNTNAGLGYAGFSLSKDTLYTMGARNNAEHLIALDVKDGKEKWAAPMGPMYPNRWGGGPRGTPTLDGDRIYSLSATGALVCADAANGKVVWKAEMKDLGGILQNWGYTESVLVDGDKVVCTPGGPKGAMAAFDKKTGKLLWQSKDFKEPAQYSSIVPAEINGKRQYVQLTMKKLVGIDAATGATIWSSDWPGATAVIPTPIVHGNHVYVTSGYGVGCKLVKIDENNKPSDVYQNKVMVNHHGGVVLVGEHLYGFSDGNRSWVCQNFKTGEEVWASKNLGKGALTYADGKLYLLEESSGNIVLIDASPEGWKEHGRFKLDPQTKQRSPQGRIWTHPVIADGKLYLRDQELLFCFDVKAK